MENNTTDENDMSELRTQIAGYGGRDLTQDEKINLMKLKDKLAMLEQGYIPGHSMN